MHFLAGDWVTCIAPEWYYALLMGFFIGLLKEVAYKYLRKFTFDVWDWMATFAGSVVTALVLIGFKRRLKVAFLTHKTILILFFFVDSAISYNPIIRSQAEFSVKSDVYKCTSFLH